MAAAARFSRSRTALALGQSYRKIARVAPRERHELRLAEPTLRELFRKPVVRKQIGRLGGWQYHVEAAEF